MPSQRRTGPTAGLSSSNKKTRNTNRKVNKLDQEINEEAVRAEMEELQLRSGEPPALAEAAQHEEVSPAPDESENVTASRTTSVDRASSDRGEEDQEEEKPKDVLKSVSFYDIADVVAERESEAEQHQTHQEPSSDEFVVENLNEEGEAGEIEDEAEPDLDADDQDEESESIAALPVVTSSAPVVTRGGGIAFRVSVAASSPNMSPKHKEPSSSSEENLGHSLNSRLLQANVESTIGAAVAASTSGSNSPSAQSSSSNSPPVRASTASSTASKAMSFKGATSPGLATVDLRAEAQQQQYGEREEDQGHQLADVEAAKAGVAKQRAFGERKQHVSGSLEEVEPTSKAVESEKQVVKVNPSEVVRQAKEHYEMHNQLLVAGYLLKRKLEDRILQKFAKKDAVVQDILERFQDVENVRHTLALIERGRVEKERKEQAGGEGVEEGVVDGEVDELYDAPPSGDADGLQDMRSCRKSVRKLPAPGAGGGEQPRTRPVPDESKYVEKETTIYDSLSDEELFGEECSKKDSHSEEEGAEPQNSALEAHQHPQHALQVSPAAEDAGKVRPQSKWKLIREYDGIRAAMRMDQVFQDPRLEETRVLTFSMEGACELDLFSILALLNEADAWSSWVPTFMGLGLVKSEVLEQSSPTNFVVRLLLRLPFPFAWRKVVFRVRGFDAMKAPLHKEDAKREVKQVIMQLENVSETEEREILTRSETYSADNEAEYEGAHRAFLENSFLLITPMRNPVVPAAPAAAAAGEGAGREEDEDEEDQLVQPQSLRREDADAAATKRSCYLQVVINVAPGVSSCPEWLVNATFKNLAFLIFDQIRQGGRLLAASLYRDRYMDPNNELYSYLGRRINEEIKAHGAPAMVDMPPQLEEEPVETVHKVRKLIEKQMADHQMAQQQPLDEAGEKVGDGTDELEDLLPNPPGVGDPLMETRDTTPTTSTLSPTGDATPDTASNPGTPRQMRETIVYAPDPINRNCVVAQKVRVPAELPHGAAAQEARMTAVDQEKHRRSHQNIKQRGGANNSNDDFSSSDSDEDEERERQVRQAAFHASVKDMPATYDDPAYLLHADMDTWETRTNASRYSRTASVPSGAGRGRASEVASGGQTPARRVDKDGAVHEWRSASGLHNAVSLEALVAAGDAVVLRNAKGNSTATSTSGTNNGKEVVLDKAWALNYLHNERRVTILNVQEGMKVRPGLHWRYANEHLHQAYGRVVKYDLVKRFVRVEWESKGWFSTETKVYSHYRMGPTAFDLAVWKEEDELV